MGWVSLRSSHGTVITSERDPPPPAHNGKEWKSCGSLLAPSCSPAARLTDDGNDKNKVSKKYIFSYHISFTSQSTRFTPLRWV